MSNSVVSPQALLTRTLEIADGGIETALEARLGQELPEFAAFVLLETESGRAALTEYYRPFVTLAATEGFPLVLDTPTWRANPDWGALLGYDSAGLDRVNAAAVQLVRESAAKLAPGLELTVSGCVGPRYDEAAEPEGDTGRSSAMESRTGAPHGDEARSATEIAEHSIRTMTADEAETYHAPQVRALAAAGTDRVSAVTMTTAAEAVGVVRAARAAGVPATASFAVGADGHLPGGATLARAILEVEEATNSYPDGYLVNCAHPSEAARALSGRELSEAEARLLSSRIIGFRLNSARHGEEGPGDNPSAFAQGMLALRPLAPSARIFGGCCGTDAPHISAIVDGLAAKGSNY